MAKHSKNSKNSKKVGSKTSKVLRNSKSKIEKPVDKSALTQAPDKKKKK